MSLGIAFKGPEGIVLAADSRVTLTSITSGGHSGTQQFVPATYDNATKLLSVKGQGYVGAVTYGLGAIGQTEPRTAHSYIPEFETELAQAKIKRLSVEEFAQRLADFFLVRWRKTMPDPYVGPDMIFLVGGYNEGEAYGRVYDVIIPSRPIPNEQSPNDFGITWGGQGEFAGRLLHGYDPNLPQIVKTALALTDEQAGQLQAVLQSGALA